MEWLLSCLLLFAILERRLTLLFQLNIEFHKGKNVFYFLCLISYSLFPHANNYRLFELLLLPCLCPLSILKLLIFFFFFSSSPDFLSTPGSSSPSVFPFLTHIPSLGAWGLHNWVQDHFLSSLPECLSQSKLFISHLCAATSRFFF